mmetsp:Transcript_42412/g.31061  ORF Transcript_42412/g.31061 Transcript_42412/m.31061 type:complete len:97 (-) Transcript_42412:606-896(-)
MHRKYDQFAPCLYSLLEKAYFDTPKGSFTKKRNLIRLASELYLKGLIKEFKKVFVFVNVLFKVTPEDALEDFQNAIQVITDFLKTYAEVFFHILSK